MPIPDKNIELNNMINDKSGFKSTNELSNFNIEDIVAAAESAIPAGGIDMRDIENSVKVDINAPLESEEIVHPINHKGHVQIGVLGGPSNADMKNAINSIFNDKNEIDEIAASFEKNINNVSLFDIENGTNPTADMNAIASTANSAKDTFDLSDDDVFKMIDTLTNMRNNPKYPVYANLPEKIQLVIAKLAYDNKIPVSQLDLISRSMMDELLKDAGIDNALIDLEKAIDEALQIPSIVDLYSDHTRNIMENIIPETVEKIQDEFPDKAKMLMDVKHAFQDSYNYCRMKMEYCAHGRIRKTVRRWKIEFDRVLDKFNYMNEKTNFKMNDVHQVPVVLKQVLIDDPNNSAVIYRNEGKEIPELTAKLVDMNISIEDIRKFTILLCKHCENLDPTNVIDAAYMYYLIRNIITLKHAQEAKTDFSVQLINNICSVISYIRDKESDFNESNLDKSKSAKKSNSNKRNHK